MNQYLKLWRILGLTAMGACFVLVISTFIAAYPEKEIIVSMDGVGEYWFELALLFVSIPGASMVWSEYLNSLREPKDE